MLTVHHLDNSRSQRVLWMLEELGVEYDIVKYQRDKETMLAPPALRAVHPLGKSPVVTDGEHTLAESGAILEYLVEQYGDGRFVPARGTPAHLRYRYWMHYAEGSAMPPLLLALVAQRIAGAKVPFFVKPVVRKVAASLESGFVGPQLALHFGYIAKELDATGWFAGDAFTAADVQMSFPLEAGAKRAGAQKHPSIRAFLERIHARPAYQRALARGGEYTLFG
ncbi:glutathione S-transferase family protein [Paraburkholderia tropica]|uniref:glutathione transferase n=1 Tax=Paraburkholderia tropica TaxID=92647 RepID=A0A1A5X565_9BURK|nr:glutathione S-transferase [Paraburkholderia tropica]MBB2984079.1 glutathione S-transferase [Paraburkholderia tropica]MBB3004897.1 glutathione S-transferase [Paraburkholderia tropica]MBB6323960.1 glutathione S-transferase [Paraburkholderia tropica]MDE1139711.1 glutathione S-transferase [Paraburkholderia tropica]OBR48547.1 glutathione S-transferase [Paraburkholderia tropica]